MICPTLYLRSRQQKYPLSMIWSTTTLINTHNSNKQHSQKLTNTISQAQSPNTPNNSHLQNKWPSTQLWVIFQLQIIYQLCFKETYHVLLRVFHLSPRGRNLGQKSPNSLQQCLFIRLQSYFCQIRNTNYFFNKEYFAFYGKENSCLPH